MQMDKLELLKALQSQNDSHLDFIKNLRSLEEEILLQKPNPDSWNTLECVEHLRRYADFYVPVISTALINSTLENTKEFKSSWLGDYFAKAMLPGSKKMGTFKSKNPLGDQIKRDVIDQLITHLNALNEALELAKSKDIKSIKVKTTIPFTRDINLIHT
jgi:hypothetical protein